MKIETIHAFQFATAPRLIFAEGAVLELGLRLGELGVRRPLLVTDPGLVRLGLIAPALEALAESGFEVTVFDAVSEDPPESVVIDAVDLLQRAACDSVVAIGGGSSMDVAKVVAVLGKSTAQPLAALYGTDQVRGGRLPLLLVPTTAGTGSEVTPIAVLTTGATTKAGISSRVLLPDVAVLDPLLTLGLPPRITAMTGIDAMVHAIEAYTSRHRKNPLSDALARQALVLLYNHLPTAVRDGANRAARAAMLLGAMLAGQAFANAPVAAVHALAYPLGGHYHLPHGLSNSLVLPAVLRFNLPVAAPHYAELAELLVPTTGSAEARAAALIAALETMLRTVQLPTTLATVAVPERDLPMLAREAMLQQRLLVNNPRDMSEDDALAIYRAAWHGVEGA